MIALAAAFAVVLGQQASSPPGDEPLSPPPAVPAPAMPAPAVPQQVPAPLTIDAASELKRKLLFMRADRNNYTLVQDTRTIELGLFGGDAMDIFAEVPAADDQAKSFRTKRIVGFILNTVGLGLIVIDAAYLALTVLAAPSGSAGAALNAGLVVYVILAIPAVVLSAVGGLLQQSAVSNLFNAVSRYNAAQINKQLPENNRINLEFFSRSMPVPFMLPLTWSI